MRYEGENIWLTQKMMATLYDVSVAAINQYIKKIYMVRMMISKAEKEDLFFYLTRAKVIGDKCKG